MILVYEHLNEHFSLKTCLRGSFDGSIAYGLGNRVGIRPRGVFSKMRADLGHLLSWVVVERYGGAIWAHQGKPRQDL